MKKELPKWASLLYFTASGLFFLAAIIWFLGTYSVGQHSMIYAVVFLCEGIALFSIGLATRKKQKKLE